MTREPRFLFGCSLRRGQPPIILGQGPTRGPLVIVPELEGFAAGLLAKGNSSCQGASKAVRRTDRRVARRRPEGTTVPGEKGVGVLLATSVQEVERPVSRELLPLPIPFRENEVAESERIRGLSRAVRSLAGWQGWANAGRREEGCVV